MSHIADRHRHSTVLYHGRLAKPLKATGSRGVRQDAQKRDATGSYRAKRAWCEPPRNNAPTVTREELAAAKWVADHVPYLIIQCKIEAGRHWREILAAGFLKCVHRRQRFPDSTPWYVSMTNLQVAKIERQRNSVAGCSKHTRVFTNCHADPDADRSSVFENIAAYTPRPEEELVQREERDRIVDAIKALDPRQKQIIGWYLDGRTASTMAGEFGVTKSAVNRCAAAAIDKLSDHLDIPIPPRTKGRPRIDFLAFREWDERWLGGEGWWVDVENRRDGYTVLFSAEEDGHIRGPITLSAAKNNGHPITVAIYGRGTRQEVRLSPGDEIRVSSRGLYKIEACAAASRQKILVEDLDRSPAITHNN